MRRRLQRNHFGLLLVCLVSEDGEGFCQELMGYPLKMRLLGGLHSVALPSWGIGGPQSVNLSGRVCHGCD